MFHKTQYRKKLYFPETFIPSKNNLFYIDTNEYSRMNVKIDTKEKFTVITPEVAVLSANMTVELGELLHSYLQKETPHLILNLKNVRETDEHSCEKIVALQQLFYEKNCSFVICELQPPVASFFDKKELLDSMNVTPSESEAWDIVQMEEIERELLEDFDEPNNE